MKQRSDYFSHDFHARLELTGVMRQFGLYGVGLFWCLVEILHEEGGEIPESSLPDIAYQLQIKADDLRYFVQRSGMFYCEDGKVKNHRVNENLRMINEKIERLKEAANTRWGQENKKKAAQTRKPTPKSKPTKDEVQRYATEAGLRNVSIERFWLYLGGKEWKNAEEWQNELHRWDESDAKKARPATGQKDGSGSFETSDFYKAALAKSYRGTGL